eukprot:758867-Hanusia_phi.AAC.1
MARGMIDPDGSDRLRYFYWEMQKCVQGISEETSVGLVSSQGDSSGSSSVFEMNVRRGHVYMQGQLPLLHEHAYPSQREEGQVAVLVKKDPDARKSADDSSQNSYLFTSSLVTCPELQMKM